jgi:hypothetical protein
MVPRLLFNSTEGYAVVQAVSGRHAHAGAGVSSHSSLYGICGGQNGTEASFSLCVPFSPSVLFL